MEFLVTLRVLYHLIRLSVVEGRSVFIINLVCIIIPKRWRFQRWIFRYSSFLAFFFFSPQLLITLIMSSNLNLSVLVSRHRLLFYIAMCSLPLEVLIVHPSNTFLIAWTGWVWALLHRTLLLSEVLWFAALCSVLQNSVFKMWTPELDTSQEYKSKYHTQR